MGTAKEALQSLLAGEVSDNEKLLADYSHDASLFEIKPQLVVSPKHTADIKKLVRYVTDHPQEKLSLTARAAGTDMSGGPLNNSIIVDFKPHFRTVGQIARHSAAVQPGVYYRDFEKATLKHNLILPCYPASRELCTVGGMVANNSAGEKTLSYGQTIDYVKRLQVVLADGNEYTLEPLSGKQLQAKLNQTDFEGDIYRRVYALVTKHYDSLQKARPNVSKNATGYSLWDAWDGETLDLTKLFVGSQGTLGLITEIEFELVQPEPHSRLLVLFLKDMSRLAEIIETTLSYRPESFESYDHHTLGLALRFLPEIAGRMGKNNLFSLAWQFVPELGLLMRAGIPKLILLAEFTGKTHAEATEKMLAAQKALQPFALPMYLTKNKQDAKKYWVIRRESFNLLRHHVRSKHTAPFIDDIIVPPTKLPHFLPELEALMQSYDLLYTIAGHIGDGNFHIIPLMDLEDPRSSVIIPELMQKVFHLVFRYGGSMSAEHNDGLIRSPFLLEMYGAKIYSLFKEVKTIFDPQNIFNPGKKIGVSQKDSMKHLLRHNS